MLLSGRFPVVEFADVGQPRPVLREVDPRNVADGARGQLILIGCSEMFKNAHLEEPGFAHSQFLLNAVTYLAYGDDMTEIQSRRRRVRGFAFLSSAMKLQLRALTLGLAPVLILLCGLVRYLRRRRPLAVSSSP